MSALGHKQTLKRVRPMSALPPRADIRPPSCDVRFGPEAAVDGRPANLGEQNARSFARHELPQHKLYLGLAFERAVLAILELNPALVEAIKHLRAWRWILHALRSE